MPVLAAVPVPVPRMAGIAEALLDRECRVFCEDAALGDQIAPFGAMQVPLPLADHAFLSLADLERVGQVQVQVGSDLYPDEGATVVAPATFGTGQRLRLTGPGIETATEIAIDGLAHGFWSLRAARCRYPAGFELFLICGAKVIGLPRSTMIEVL